MLAEMEISVVRDRNERMLREVRTERLKAGLRAAGGRRPGARYAFGALSSRGFALLGAAYRRAGGGEVGSGVRP